MAKKIAIQGQPASFHDIAARQYFGSDIEIEGCNTFLQTFQALESSRVDYAVAAIENSLFGSINEVYDLLLKHRFWVSGEVYLRIEQCLVGLPDSVIGSIKEVHSHPVALAQCEQYLDTKLKHAERFEHHDTAGSAADIKKWGDPAKAAIASRAAAELNGLKILEQEIETHKQNYTRFVALSKQPIEDTTANKTSLIFNTEDKPGALYLALGAFVKQDINLTKLQSRPLIGKAWHYIFYADVDSGLHTGALQAALSELGKQGCDVTILGSYNSANQPSK